jgi:uncharacterized cupredoxin-like copper-binding protein
MHRTLRLASAGIVLAALAGCGGAGSTAGPSAGGATTVGAQEKEFSISLDKSTLPVGHVTFNVQNGGTIAHEFVVIDTDKPADQLPQASGEVDEDALAGVGEVEDIAPGTSKTLEVDLPAGHYVIICNVPGHYAAGMHADVTVQ